MSAWEGGDLAAGSQSPPHGPESGVGGQHPRRSRTSFVAGDPSRVPPTPLWPSLHRLAHQLRINGSSTEQPHENGKN